MISAKKLRPKRYLDNSIEPIIIPKSDIIPTIPMIPTKIAVMILVMLFTRTMNGARFSTNLGIDKSFHFFGTQSAQRDVRTIFQDRIVLKSIKKLKLLTASFTFCLLFYLKHDSYLFGNLLKPY